MRGIVEVTTGAGKTRLAIECMKAFLVSGGERVVIVVPSIALQDQWHIQVREHLDLGASDVALIGGGSRTRQTGLISIAVLNSARSHVPRVAHPDRALLIVDEVHRAGSPANVKALHNNFRATLGMSATPEGSYDSRLDALLIPALGGLIFRYELVEALHDGIVAPFSLTNVEIALTAAEAKLYRDFSKRISRLSKLAMSGEETTLRLKTLLQKRAAVSAKAVQRIPAAVTLALKWGNGRLIVFHEYISHASLIAAALNKHGLRSCLYTSRESSSHRFDNLRLFRRGHFDVLVACRALDEGLDIPDLSAAIIASSSATKRQRIQRLGRVVRSAPGKASAEVFTIYGTKAERERLVREQDRLSGLIQARWIRMTRRS